MLGRRSSVRSLPGLFVAAVTLIAVVPSAVGEEGPVTAASVLRATVARPPSALEMKLCQEFEGSYPRETPESTGVKRWSITAEPSVVEVFEGRRLEVWAYNGTIPGPSLRLRLGQTLRVEFTNKLPQPTTIHWHGVRLPNAMDGVPFVTQPPVMPGQSFVYEFTPKDAGTYWFHPHMRGSEQVERGLYGTLIVEDPEPLPYTQDVMWILDDWRIADDGQIDPRFNTRSDLAHDGRMGNVITVNGRTDTVLTVKAGERIRLRLLNSANGRVFVPSFWPLDAAVIAIDGKYAAEPFRPTRFEMAPGNRMDFDITIQPEYRGKTLEVRNRYNRQPVTLARIRVLDEWVETPRFPSPASAFIPQWEDAETVEPRLSYTLNNRIGGQYGIEWTLNDKAYPEQAVAEVLYSGEWAKIRYTNVSSRMHPMHIHGVFFKLLTRDGRKIPERFWRDTVLTRPRETVEIGLVPLDEGRWMLHCHILEHAAAGMMTLIEVKPRPQPAQ